MGKEITLLKEKLQKKAEKVVSALLCAKSDVLPVSIRLAQLLVDHPYA